MRPRNERATAFSHLGYAGRQVAVRDGTRKNLELEIAICDDRGIHFVPGQGRG
jgi:hypothetical protein